MRVKVHFDANFPVVTNNLGIPNQLITEGSFISVSGKNYRPDALLMPSTKAIATEIGISPKTVDVHRANLKEKLGVPDMPSLIRHAVCWVETQDPRFFGPRSVG